MLCSICQNQAKLRCQLHMIYFCDVHLTSHFSETQNINCRKMTDAMLPRSSKKKLALEDKLKRRLNVNELYQKGLMSNRDLNSFDIEEKKIFMDNLKIMMFENAFGIGNENRDYIRDISFSNDKKFSFVCIKYLGKQN